jgi:hypothetical protein
VGGNVTIAAGGTFQSAATGAIALHVLSLGGNLTNNGTLDFSTSANTAGTSIMFTGAANASFTGTGATDLRFITLNKGSTPASVLDFSPANLTVRGVTVNTVNTTGMLSIVNGTFKLGGTFSGTNPLGTTASWSIPLSGGLWLANPNYTIAATGGTVTVSGVLIMDAGTMNVGNSSGNRLA